MITDQQVQAVAANYTKDTKEIEGFLTLWKFLTKHADFFGWRSKTKPNLNEIRGLTELAEKYYK